MTLTQITKIRGPGIHTTSNIVSHNINSSGIITAVAFKGPFTGSSNIQSGILTATKIDLNGDIDVDGHTNLDNVSIAGVTTTAGLLDINAGGRADTFKVEDLTDNRVVIAGSGGELEDSGNLTFDGSTLAVTGGVTATTGTFSGNVSIGGTLTYEDVTNIDSVGLVTARNGLRVTGGTSIFTGNTTFNGTNTFAGNSVVSGNYLDIQDGKKLRLGTDGDCAFYYNGSATLIETGNKIIHMQSDASIRLQRNSPQQHMLVANAGGSVDLYHSGTQRFETTNTGAVVTGILTATSFSGGLPITNGADNRVITASSASAIQGESNFTYDGDEVAIYAQTDNADCILHLVGKTPNGGVGQAGRTAIIAESTSTNNGQSSMHLRTRNTSNAQLIAMTLDGNQNVGIGTQLPNDIDSIGRALNIASSTGGAIYLQDTDSPTTKFGVVSYNGATAALQIEAHHASSYIDLGTNGTERLRIKSDGIIETGTAIGASGADSDQRLRVGRDGNCNISVRATASTTAYTGIDFGDSGDDRAGRIQYMHNGDYMSFHTNGAGSGSSNERLRINSTGELGIGVAAASGNQLHIKNGGTADAFAKIESESGYDAALLLDTSNGGGASADVRFQMDGSTKGSIQYVNNASSADANSMLFRTGNNSTKMQITTGGNVNIGGDYAQTTYTMKVTGSFAATTKSFVIDHPTKENHQLRYACLEGPENSVYVRGRSSDPVIELPDYWIGLVHDDSITVNVTPIGNKNVWVESINNNSVTIGSDDSTEYFYTVFAERKDVEKLEVEVEN